MISHENSRCPIAVVTQRISYTCIIYIIMNIIMFAVDTLPMVVCCSA